MCIKAFRIIRGVEDNPVKEYIKNFLRLEGCLVVDVPCQTQGEMFSRISSTANEESLVDIVLKRDSTMSDREIKVIEVGANIVQVEYKVLPTTGKADWWDDLLTKFVDCVWKDELYHRQMKVVQEVYSKYKLFGYLVIKQGFAVRNMPEICGTIFGDNVDIQDKRVEYDTFIEEMTKAFQNAEGDLKKCHLDEYGRIPYVKYTQINLQRKVREVYQALNDTGKTLMSAHNIATKEELLDQLHLLYQADPKYLGTKFLAAIICSKSVNAPSMAEYYFKRLLSSVIGRQDSIHSFAFYEYGRYLEKMHFSGSDSVRSNWENAIPYYEAAVELNPFCYQAQFKIASYYVLLNKNDEAIVCFRKVIQTLMRDICNFNMDNLSLKGIQYLFKVSYVLKNLYNIDVGYTEMALESYKRANSIFQVYDSDLQFYNSMREYHEKYDLRWALDL